MHSGLEHTVRARCGLLGQLRHLRHCVRHVVIRETVAKSQRIVLRGPEQALEFVPQITLEYFHLTVVGLVSSG